MDTFYGHSMNINEHYQEFAQNKEHHASDRDRFVEKFFRKYSGKHIVLMDIELVAYTRENWYFSVEPCSTYSSSFQEIYNHGTPICRNRRRYLFVSGFRAVNEMYGSGFIEMDCFDHLGDSFRVRIDYTNLGSMQFKEITKEEFDAVSDLFTDDREEVPYKVTRYLTWEEMKAKKKRGNKPVKETVTVMAKDANSAAEKVENAIEVESC